jgi:hypothetical protein
MVQLCNLVAHPVGNAGLDSQPFQLSSFWRTDISLQTRYTHFQHDCMQKKEIPVAMDRAFLIRNIRFVAFVFAFIVWLWGFYLLSSLAGIGTVQTSLLPLLPALPLLLAAILFARQSRSLLSRPAIFSNKRQLWMYLSVVALTMVSITVVNRVLHASHLSQWQWPASIFLVGLHFLGLIPVFRDWRHILPATLVFCLPALLVPILVPETYMLGTLSVHLGWQFATALVCWPFFLGSDVFLLIRGRQLLQGFRGERTANVQGT